jgi:transcriptional regulator with XRE-family HTH domain
MRDDANASIDGSRSLGPIIRQLVSRRQQLGLSQAELNDLIGFSDGMISKFETLRRQPTTFTLICWLSALKMRLVLEPLDE